MPDVVVEFEGTPGWETIVAPSVHLFVGAEAATLASDTLEQLRGAAVDGLEAVLDALAAGGVRSMPAFVAVEQGAPARVVARGSAYAVATTPTGVVEIHGPARGVWTDEDAPTDCTHLLLRSGIPVPDAAFADAGPDAGAAPVPDVAPVPEAVSVPEAAPVPDSATHAPGTDSVSPGWRLPSRLGGGVQPLLGGVPDATPRPSAGSTGSTPGSSTDSSSNQHSDTSAEPEDEPEDLPSYDHLFGATEHARSALIGSPGTGAPADPSDPGAQDELKAAGGFSPDSAPEGGNHLTLPPPGDTQRPPVAPPLAASSSSTPSVAAPPAVGAPVPPAPTPPPPPVPPAAPVAGELIQSVPWRRPTGSPAAPVDAPVPPPPPGVSPTSPAPTAAPPPAVLPSAPAVLPAPPPSVPPSAPGGFDPPVPPAYEPPPAPPATPVPPSYEPPPPPGMTPAPPVHTGPPVHTPPPPLTHHIPHPAPPPPSNTPAPPSSPPAPPSSPPPPPHHTPAPPASNTPAPPAYEPGQLEDDVEATVDRSALLAAAGHAGRSGPLVLAVLCPAGHPSPPHAATCRTCGRDVPPQQPFQTPRPALGTLRLADGETVTLDRGVLLGRQPRVNAELAAADRPHLVRLPSPQKDISRNHAEIILEGWHVMVRDLGSTNGTTVTLPGQPAMRLGTSDQQVIEPGTVITLADETSLTFEGATS